MMTKLEGLYLEELPCQTQPQQRSVHTIGKLFEKLLENGNFARHNPSNLVIIVLFVVFQPYEREERKNAINIGH